MEPITRKSIDELIDELFGPENVVHENDYPVPNLPAPPWWVPADDPTRKLVEAARQGPYWLGDYDPQAFERALRLYGIKQPVVLHARLPHRWEYPGPTDMLMGLHQYDPVAQEHQIWVRPGVNIDTAQNNLAHELTHAMQIERDGYDNHFARKARHHQENGWSHDAYLTSPAEVEARAVAEERANQLEVLTTD